MIETRLKLAHVKTGDPRQITFLIAATDIAKARKFIAMKNEREAKAEEIVWIDAELRFWYPERTPAQNRFYWRFVNALAKDAMMSQKEMHEVLKEALLPHDLTTKRKMVKRGKTWELVDYQDAEPVSTTTLTTVEFAEYCEQVILLAADRGLSIYAEYIEWHEWLAANQWPLSESYRSKDDYRERHPVCEFCGADIKWEDGRYARGGGEIMHIVSRGAGGPDLAWDLIHACADCHRLSGDSQHQGGFSELLAKYPHMRYRIEYAEKRRAAEAQKGKEYGIA